MELDLLQKYSPASEAHEICSHENRALCPVFLQSGAKINISDGSCPERIVTVTGSTDAIYKAFTLICNKFEEVSEWKTCNDSSMVLTPFLGGCGPIAAAHPPGPLDRL